MTPAKTPNPKNEPPKNNKTRKAPRRMARDMLAQNRILSILDGFSKDAARRILRNCNESNEERDNDPGPERPDQPSLPHFTQAENGPGNG